METAMAELFASGRAVDIMLAVVAIEALALLALWYGRRRQGRSGGRLSPLAVAGLLASGVCLMVALRLALTGAWWGYVALALLMAFLTHLLDLARRLREG